MSAAAAGVSWLAIAPELALLVGAVATLLVEVYRHPSHRALGTIAGVTIGVAFSLAAYQWIVTTDEGPMLSFGNMILTDSFTVFARFVLLVVAALGLAAGWEMVVAARRRAAEAIALVLLATIGFQAMAASVHLMMTFLALEIGSISLYILAGFSRQRAAADEAALKYFLLGAFASAIFVYGIALTYAGTGFMSLVGVGLFLKEQVITQPAVILMALALLLAGLAFKISAAPFHAWAPDVYQGAPAGIVGFMAAAAKIGGFAALVRILVIGFPTLSDDWGPALAALAAVSLVVGTTMAIVQDDVRRMLAYSGVAHAGFILLGVVAGAAGTAAVWFYLAVYGVQVVAGFAIIAVVAGANTSGSDIGEFAGLAQRSPFLAGSMSIMLLALAGIPLTSGFIAKFGVFVAAWGAGYEWLVVLALLGAVAGLFFYLRIIVVMYMRAPAVVEAPGAARARPQAVGASRWTLIVSLAITIALGVYPGPLLELLRDAFPT